MKQKARPQYFSLVLKLKHDCKCRAKTFALTFCHSSTNKITGTQHDSNAIALIMGCSTGISRRHKSGTGNMEGRERKTPIKLHVTKGNCSGSESKNSNESTSPVITAPSRPNQVVTNPPRTSPVQQNSSILSNIVTTPETQVLNSFRTGTSSGSTSPVIPIALQANFVSCHQESSQTSQEEYTVNSS